MLADDRIPGVYLEEVFLTPKPELMTGVPAFLGLTADGLFETPQLLTLWPQFEQNFGSLLSTSEGYLAYAVRGFFENGGQLCYVIRIQEATSTALEAGLEAITSSDTIDLIGAPDIALASQHDALEMQKAVLNHCQQIGDRFAILDAFRSLDLIHSQQQSLSDINGAINGALYAPWLKVQPIGQTTGEALVEVPPCGHIAGVYAKSDRAAGVYQSPANYVLESVLDLSLTITNDDFKRLNPEANNGKITAVNCCLTSIGRGIRVWGSRTLSPDSLWRYISVRRLFLTVGRWCDRYLADVTFEPNNFRLWLRIERELTAYCESLFRQGALKGNTPQEAFYVKCDAETNPQEIRDRGVVLTEIGLAPMIPCEFIIVRLIHGSTGVSVTT
jgi:phage tail sheath protein FI